MRGCRKFCQRGGPNLMFLVDEGREQPNTTLKDKYLSNNTGTTHYDSLQGSYWADQKNSHNEVIMTFLLGQ